MESGRAEASKDILTTLYYPRRRAWVERAELIDPASLSRQALLRRLLSESRRYHALVLNGSVGLAGGYVDLAAAGIVGRRRASAPLVVLSECAWKRKKGLEHLTRRALIEAIDNPRIVYCVLTTAERKEVPRVWGLDPSRVVFTPYCHNLKDQDLDAPPEDDGSVFAGGNALRDYDPLLAAASELRETRFTILTDTMLVANGSHLPANVTQHPASGGGFIDRLRKARVVVVPLRVGTDRAVGLMTYLSAMALEKVVIVAEAPGTDDYIEHGRTGFVVPPGDARALTEQLRWVLDPAHADETRAIAAHAAEVGRTRFTPDNHVASLLEVVDTFGGSR